MQRKPYNHQVNGINHVLKAKQDGFKGDINTHQMGLGKTYLMLTLAAEMVPQGCQTLVIAPKSTLDHWCDEYELIHGNKDGIQLYHGKNRILNDNAKVIVTTERTLLYDMKLHGRKSKIWSTVFYLVIIDEAHQFANIVPRGPRSYNMEPLYCKLFSKLQRKFTIPMTGTPFKNHQSDIQSLLYLAGICKGDKCMSLKDIATLFAKHSHRATVEEVKTQMPVVHHNIIELEYATPKQHATAKNLQNEYKTLAAQAQSFTASGRPIPPELFTRLMTSLTQARLYDVLMVSKVGDIPNIYNLKTNAKLQAMMQLIRKTVVAKKQKMVITSYFVSVLHVVAAVIKQELNGTESTIMYTGDMTVEEQTLAKKQFKENSGNILLLSKSAGGCGLNLFGSHMVILEPGLNQAADSQVEARIIRLGQTHRVDIHYLKHSQMDTYVWTNMKQRKLAISSVFVPDEKSNLSSVFNCKPDKIDEIISAAHAQDEDILQNKKKQNVKKKTKEPKKRKSPHIKTDNQSKTVNHKKKQKVSQVNVIPETTLLNNRTLSISNIVVRKRTSFRVSYRSQTIRNIRCEFNKTQRWFGK